jgi:guanylate kinase
MSELSHKLILFCGPSGSGKTTIVHHLLENNTRFSFSVSATTRKKRSNEIHGRDYYFLSLEEFKSKIENDEFVEWEEVYESGYYGTLKSEITRISNLGKHVIFDVDVEGGLKIKKLFGSSLLSVFVMPPSIEDLKHRLKSRATETQSDLQRRLEKAEQELKYCENFDRVIINKDLDQSLREAQEMVDKFLEKFLEK